MNGRFIWFDLMTTDLQGARTFYSEVFGWKGTKWPGGDYELWSVGETQIGGLMALPEDARKQGAPPHWLGYIGVDDVDAAVATTQKLGGKVPVPGTDIPDVGRFAVVMDPQGADFALFNSRRGEGAPDPRAIGGFGWAELNSTDWPAAWKFYSALFGWKPTQTFNMGPEYGDYFMFGTDPATSMGGMSNAANMMKAPAHWLYYVNVQSADQTAKLVQAKGGKVLNGPMDIPGGGRIAQCLDPQGGAFAFVSY